jgi:endonuclease/exonuclease/phosphatase family metal-dependent hydrolase
MKLYTWNVLNPAFAPMTWVGFNAQHLGAEDQTRNKYRQHAVAEVVRGWLRGKEVVVCLQEVWPALRAALQKEHGASMAATDDNKVDCRVTLVSGFRIAEARTVALPAEPPKSALACVLERGGRSFECVNVHLHWRWGDLKRVARALLPRGAQILAGDFNKEWGELGPLLRGRRGARVQGVTAINPRTNKLAAIDHVLASIHFNQPRARIVANASGYALRYDFDAILRLKTPWLTARPRRDVSDHSPLNATVTYRAKTRKIKRFKE